MDYYKLFLKPFTISFFFCLKISPFQDNIYSFFYQ